MPQPPGGRGQKSIFAFPGFKKYVEVRGVRHEVVPPALDDFDAKHPLLCRWGCGERFSRGTAKANHEKHCKKKLFNFTKKCNFQIQTKLGRDIRIKYLVVSYKGQ